MIVEELAVQSKKRPEYISLGQSEHESNSLMFMIKASLNGK